MTNFVYHINDTYQTEPLCALSEDSGPGPAVLTDELSHAHSQGEVGRNDPGEVREPLCVVQREGSGGIRNLDMKSTILSVASREY